MIAYARANGLNRMIYDSPRPRLGIIACGKAYMDVRQALQYLGIDESEAKRLGLVGGRPLDHVEHAGYCS